MDHVETLGRLRAARDVAAGELEAVIAAEADASHATGLKRLLRQAEHALNPSAREAETQQLRERLAVIDSAIGSFTDLERQRRSDEAAAVAHKHLPAIAKARRGLLAAMHAVADALAAVDAALEVARKAGGSVPAKATVCARDAAGWRQAIAATEKECERDTLALMPEAEGEQPVKVRALSQVGELLPGAVGMLPRKRAGELALLGVVERIAS